MPHLIEDGFECGDQLKHVFDGFGLNQIAHAILPRRVTTEDPD